MSRSNLALAERAGSPGQVLGVDVSAPMLARAAERLLPGAPVKFVHADATTYRFESAAFDLLFSRFGVMFFAELHTLFAGKGEGAWIFGARSRQRWNMFKRGA
jgi:ubiquinone/menaquinone biosynthesis C-methylase UbiE